MPFQLCATQSGNRFESISDAALRLYYHFPNDPLLHTGKHRDDVPDNRRNLRIILENTLKVCWVVYPSEELLEAGDWKLWRW